LPNELRDFIYLDVERIRSYVAQKSGGVPTERSQGAEHQAGGQGSASGGIPLVASLKGQVDYRYVRTASETSSVQDAIFSDFMQAYHPLNISASRWPDASAAPDGQLVLVSGAIKLIDYQTSLETLRAFPKVVAAFNKFTKAVAHGVTGNQAPRQAATTTQSTAQLDSLSPVVELMSKAVGTNLTDFVRVKVVPDIERPGQAFIGDGHRDNFRYSSAVLTSLYPSGIADGWHCVGVVHRPGSSELPASAGRETMGDMLEFLLDTMGGLDAFRQAAKPPAIAITPLAVYRRLLEERH
jgi:hypothetical protein